MDFATLNERMDRVSAALQRDGVAAGSVVAICSQTSLDYAVLLLGAIRAGVVFAPLVTVAMPETLAVMIADSDAKLLFVDPRSADWLLPVAKSISVPWIKIGTPREAGSFEDWLAPPGARSEPVTTRPEWPFNIIYSSGTTGVPKGIVQSHALRWGSLRQPRTAVSGRRWLRCHPRLCIRTPHSPVCCRRWRGEVASCSWTSST